MNRRCGFTMIEMLIAIGATTVLLGLSVGLVHRAMSTHAEMRQRGQLQHEALRLSRQLRADLRNAEAASTADQGLEITLASDGVKPIASYRWSEGVVERQLKRETGDRHREVFRLAGTTLKAQQRIAPPRLVLTVSQRDPASGGPAKVLLQLEAVIGSRAFIRPREAAP